MTKSLLPIIFTGACAFHGNADPLVYDAPPSPDDGAGSDGVMPTDDASDANSHCVGFQPVAGLTSGSTYFASADTKSWYDAEAYCEDQGAHLVILDDMLEAISVNTIAGGDFFIGATDLRTEGYWRDVANRPAPYLPWKTVEPSVAAKDDCALELHTGPDLGKLDAVDCMPKKRYVCECDDGLVADPDAYTPEEK